jgi:elongation factor 1 alpha-like protein
VHEPRLAAIETETDRVQWAAAGSNVTLYLTAVDPIHLDMGRVLCPPTAPVELASAFTARIIVFDIQVPILAGTSIELFHHSRDVPAAISKLNATLDRASGAVTKQNPRVLTKGASAEVQIAIRQATFGGTGTRSTVVPLEPFSTNKEMGRILIRRGGETIAAGEDNCQLSAFARRRLLLSRYCTRYRSLKSQGEEGVCVGR